MDQLNLTEREKREIVRFVAENKPLPDKHRFLLFQNKKQMEPVWNGKTFETTNLALLFRKIETVDELEPANAGR